MKLKLKHTTLISGMAMVIFSFTFFGFSTDTYLLFLLVGLVISCMAFCSILFQKDSIKNKLIWISIVIVGIVVQWLSEPTLIRLSYILVVKTNERAFTEINQLLLAKKEDAIWVYDSGLWRRNNITKEEGSRIQELLKNSRVSMVDKDSSRIYYITFSRIDTHYGISYYFSKNKPRDRRHLIGNWYY